MPEHVMNRLPLTRNHLEAMKLPLKTSLTAIDNGMQSVKLGFDILSDIQDMGIRLTQRITSLPGAKALKPVGRLAAAQQQGVKTTTDIFEKMLLTGFGQMHRERSGELEFIKLFTDPQDRQDWTVAYDDSDVVQDLPSLRVIDISTPGPHQIANTTVVFAPRAGHHSNIAERVALYLRDQGLTRMVVVEQKCADDIPTVFAGKRNIEDFNGQVAQYEQVLQFLKRRTGFPPHLVAICQPGPLLIATLIKNPDLGRTFGSAGAPMDTEGERGFLTDFARFVGEKYIERILAVFGRNVSTQGESNRCNIYDGAAQVMGFYYLGMDQHARNLKKLLADLKMGNRESADRQKTFYGWYNSVHHFPACFIRDTFQKIFIRNELIRGHLKIGGQTLRIQDYPGSVPIWALGGKSDAIAPPLQATGHLDYISSVPTANRLKLTCDGGHMALFRSSKVLENYYTQIARFVLIHSDPDSSLRKKGR